MRPLKLQMTAFGPFSGTEEIDFDRLGENPLFLINGPTGSGKTTILDAICFALYGKTTGDEREGGQMRCDLAAAELLTEVTLEFELHRRRYRIRRVPEQLRPKSRGEGFTEQKPEAQFYQLQADGSEQLLVPSKVTEASREIENLTGLSVEQFRQVMVLPQGKFRQLLMAESAEREKIFGQLFQTGIYKRLEESLKSQSAEIRREREKQLQLQQGILEAVELESAADLARERDEVAPEAKQAEQIKREKEQQAATAAKALQQAQSLAEQFTRLGATEAALAKLQLQKEQVDRDRQQVQQAERAVQLQPLLNEFERSTRELQQAQQEAASRRQEKELCSQLLKDAEQALTGKEKLQLARDQAKQQRNELASFRSRAEQLAAARLQHQQVSHAAAISALLLDYKLLAEQQLQAAELERLERECLHQQDLLQREESTGTDLRKAYEQAAQQAKHTELAWHQGQASILAAELQPGTPCPVCGSNEHPAPAVSEQPLPTEQQLEQARVAAQRANEQLNLARERYAGEKQKLHGLQQQVERARSQAASEGQPSAVALDSAFGRLQERAQQLQVTLPRMEQIQSEGLAGLRATAEQDTSVAVAAQAQLDAAEQELPEEFRQPGSLDRATLQVEQQIADLEQKIEALVANHQAALGKTEAAAAALNAADRQLDKSSKTLETSRSAWQVALGTSLFLSEQQYRAALLPESALSSLKQRVADYDLSWQQLSGALQHQQTTLAGKEPPALDDFERRLQITEEERNQAVQRWQQLDKRLSHLAATQQKLDNVAAQQAEFDRQYAIVGTLSDVANGQTGNKISLQRFVLSVLLDDVLIAASQRLSLMSKGRYQLLRKEDRAKGNKASGLELEVEDAYTGKLRPVATLSGGESFMAALSLALGLSDVVQAYAGGIRLDTLFIDEGFGSLDSESLDLAVRTLVDLQSAGRMVGVISHVAELKEQLPLRIDLLTDRQGSRARLVAP